MRGFLAFALFIGTSFLFADDVRRAQSNSHGDLSWLAAQAAAREWTREEMLSAIAADVPALSERDVAHWRVQENSDSAYDVEGGPGLDPAGLPDDLTARHERRRSLSEEDAGASIPPVFDPVVQSRADRFDASSNARPDEVRAEGYNYPAPYNRYETFPSYADFPHRAVGKVFFKKPDGKSYVCTASSIGGDGVITAAHCVRDGKTGAWWSSWVFVPAYKNGSSPYGQWAADHLWSRGPWVNGVNGDNRYDIGGAVLRRRLLSRISAVVGNLGFMWNSSSTDTSAHWALIGYPQAAPFNGELQFICQSSFAYNGAGGSPAPLGVGCDMTGGCSGGPWIRRYSKVAGAANYVNGVNSYRRCFDSTCTSQYTHELYSPYFDANAKTLKDCLANSVPGNPADPTKGCGVGT